MKRSLQALILVFAFVISLKGQDNNVKKDVTIDRAPNSPVVSDLNNGNKLAVYGSRWFGQNAAATSFFTKGFLTTAATHSNFSLGTTSLFGAMEFDNTGKLYCIAVALNSPLQILDTTTGILTPGIPITGVSGQILGMSFNVVSNKMYLTAIDGTASDKLYTIDLTTGVGTLVGGTNANMFDIAINSTGQCYGVTVTDNLVSIDLTTGNSTLIGPIGFDANFIQGLSFDRSTDSLWYACYNQTAGRGELRRVNLSSGATTLLGPFNPTAEVCGFCIPSASVTPPTSDTVLVLLHDSTTGSTTNTGQKKADRDSLFANIRPLIRNYIVRTFDTNSTWTDLSRFKTILLVETSFDGIVSRWVGAAGRTQLKIWLNSGTALNKKSLIMVGADQGYNYSRTGSGGRDLEWAETFGKFIYRVDDATTGTAQDATQGVIIDIGNVRQMTSSPPSGGYWPDGCGMVAGGSSILYKYQNGGVTDTLAAIGNMQTGYLVASVFQDPRYYTGAFGPVIRAVIGWVQLNGGVITGNNSISSVVPETYRLEQNYPNPFNPTTNLKFSITKQGLVSLKVFDILGKEVSTLVNEVMRPGVYEFNFNAGNLSSGTYFYRLEVNGFIQTKKMQLIK